jgi:hypothetical protein
MRRGSVFGGRKIRNATLNTHQHKHEVVTIDDRPHAAGATSGSTEARHQGIPTWQK